jgi:hypothetical protein
MEFYVWLASCLTGAKTAWDLLCEEKTMKRIVTFCEDLDVILGGGICRKEVTEVGKCHILWYNYFLFYLYDISHISTGSS